jgi:hypothetical protein
VGIADTLAKCGTPIVPDGHRCVAVVDPPRSGLHPKVVRALRECKAIDRLVYVSCNPTGTFVEDAIKLCLPSHCNGKWSVGEPFLPLRAAPVDMFPDTKHCELVVVFSRESAVKRKSVMPNDYALRDARQARQEQEQHKRKRDDTADAAAIAAEVEDESAKKMAKTSQ